MLAIELLFLGLTIAGKLVAPARVAVLSGGRMSQEQKTLILITGTSTAGKTTLAEMLLIALAPKPIRAVPHTTCRVPREDDDPRLIRTLPRAMYEGSAFLSCHGDYGVLKGDIDAFRTDPDSQLGVAIVSSLDLPTLQSTLAADPLIRTVGVLVTCTGDLASERAELTARMGHYFDGSERAHRLALNLDLAEKLFFNPEYIERSVNVWVHQGLGGPYAWTQAVARAIGAALDANCDLSTGEHLLLREGARRTDWRAGKGPQP